MDKRKFVAWSSLGSLLFLGTAYNAPADVETEYAIPPLIVKDFVLPETPLKKTGQMPNFNPNPNIEYKILRVKVDPNIDYKILRTPPSGILERKSQIPEFRPDNPLKISPPVLKPYLLSPQVKPPRPEPPKK